MSDITNPLVKLVKSSPMEPHQRTSEPGSKSNRVTLKEQASINWKTPLSWCWSMTKSDWKLVREVLVELRQAWQERKQWKRNPRRSKGGAPAMIRVNGSGSDRGLMGAEMAVIFWCEIVYYS